jgi:hypothetical protein
MKDIEAGADFTSKLLKEKHAQAQMQDATDDSTEGAVKSEVAVKSEGGVKSEVAAKSEGGVKSEADEITKLWYEAQSDEGHVYYWHIETGGKYEVVRNVGICILCLCSSGIWHHVTVWFVPCVLRPVSYIKLSGIDHPVIQFHIPEQ